MTIKPNAFTKPPQKKKPLINACDEASLLLDSFILHDQA